MQSQKKIQKKLDKVFSKYIRLRDSDNDGWGRCITCGHKVHVNNAHCGHFLSRRFLSIRYDEYNANLQCKYCNIVLHGNQEKYRQAQTLKWGSGVHDYLEMKKSVRIHRTDLQKWLTYYGKATKLMIKIKKSGGSLPPELFSLPVVPS